MNRIIFLVALLLGSAALSAEPSAIAEQWSLFEITLKGPSNGNPFIDVHLAATFTQGTRAVKVSGFYDGEGIYKVRFMPDAPGPWSYRTQSNSWALTNQRGTFEVTPHSPGNHGPVGVANTFHFAYADGTPFKPFGTTVYTWTHRTEEMEAQTLKTLAASPFNKVRMCVFPQTHGTKTTPPPRFPFAGEPTRPDYTRFNPDFFRHLETRVAQLRDLGIECDLILFHAYDDDHVWGLDNMPPEVEDRYLRYVVARLAAYRNIWWSLANEYDLLHSKTDADWDANFHTLVEADPHGHLRSIHNDKTIYNHTHPWITHVSMQNGSAVEDSGRAELARDIYRKPIVYDEVVLEGNHTQRWANISGRELVHRFWAGFVAGTYVGHSEYFAQPGDPDKVVWIGQGGVLRGESPPRLAFLRKLLDNAPAAGIDPIDKWWEPRVGGRQGEYYLFYFGREKPTEWSFWLSSKGLAEGVPFTVEIIDTWEMTITPVDGVFVTRRHDEYQFADAQNRTIKLPGKEGIALRIRRAGAMSTR